MRSVEESKQSIDGRGKSVSVWFDQARVKLGMRAVSELVIARFCVHDCVGCEQNVSLNENKSAHVGKKHKEELRTSSMRRCPVTKWQR
jgi:hypothetical protein